MVGVNPNMTNQPQPTPSFRLSREENRAKKSLICTDPVVGAILSGWRYDITGNSPDLRLEYEVHLGECAYCRHRQRIHRTVDILLLAATSLSFTAFLLAALVMHRLEALSHITNVHLYLHPDKVAALARIPDSITIGLETVAIAGVVVSMLLWILVAMATPIFGTLTAMVRERISPELRDLLRKQEV
jgi:hypothetical protein